MIQRAARWSGIQLTPEMVLRLAAFQEWLRTEAIPAGGLGPGEGDRLPERHVADSLLFATGWRERRPRSILDIGSGVGLPAIPLAIAHPGTEVTALDRSGRRIRLARRAVRVLGLSNLRPVQGDVSDATSTYPAVVSRASIPPERLLPDLARLVRPGGVAVLGGSHLSRPEHAGYETVEIPTEVLDRAAWILIMGRP